jgi:uroporphyrin-III C-methyltransferase
VPFLKGKVIIVGAGPGDPGLITVKGLEALRRADVVIYDRLIPRGLLKGVKPGCELIYAGKQPGRHELEQDEINELLVDRASRGLLVVRLKGGDPYTFGRGEEECEYVVSRGLECEVVPGIPSYVGAAAYAGAPLAGRVYGSSFVVVTGRVAGGEPEMEEYLRRLRELARHVDNVVVLMGVSTSERVLTALAEAKGPSAPALAIMDATMPTQRSLAGTIEDLARYSREGLLRNPAVIIVGPAALARDRLWRADAERST